MSARCEAWMGVAAAVATLVVGAKPAAAAAPTVAVVVQGASEEAIDVEVALAGVVVGWGLSQIDPADVRAAFARSSYSPSGRS